MSKADQDRYRVWAETNSLPLFMQAWWLDTVAGADRWNVAMVEDKGDIVGAWPYIEPSQRFGVSQSVLPPLTQYLGPWMVCDKRLPGDIAGRQKRILDALVEQLPEVGLFKQTASPTFTYFSPLHWQGFTASPRYTFRLEDIADGEQVWKNLAKKMRSEIRRSASSFGIQVERATDPSTLLELVEQTFQRQGRTSPHSAERVNAIVAAASKRGAISQWIARDGEGLPHAAALCVRDSHHSFYLMSGSDPEKRSSGALSAILWQAILEAGELGLDFDFEGSMMENVESYIRAFNAKPVQYLLLERVRSRRWIMLDTLRKLRA